MKVLLERWKNIPLALKVLYISMAVGLVLRLVILLGSTENILEGRGSDDLFYYSEIAGHLSAGDGMTFDGDHPTTGVQILFLLCLLPFGQLIQHDPHAAVLVVLSLASIFTLLSACVLKRMGDLYQNIKIRSMMWYLGALLMLHPKILDVTFQGTEAGLIILILLSTIYVFLKQKQAGRITWLFGVLCGLLILTRLDMIFVLVVLGLSYRKSFFKLKSWWLAPVISLMMLGIWIMMVNSITGHFTPDSGLAKALHASHIDMSLQDYLLSFGRQSLIFLQAEATWSLMGLALFIVGLLAIFKERAEFELPKWVLALFVSGVILVLVYLATLKGIRAWYLMPLLLVGLGVMAYGLQYLSERLASHVLISVLMFATSILWFEAQMSPRQHMAPYYVKAADKAEIILPEGSVIGAFNAGYYGSRLGEQYTVVNLDGVVNHSAYQALKHSGLAAYFKSEGIDYVLDHSGSIQFFKRFGEDDISANLEAISQIDMPYHATKDITIYEVRDE